MTWYDKGFMRAASGGLVAFKESTFESLPERMVAQGGWILSDVRKAWEEEDPEMAYKATKSFVSWVGMLSGLPTSGPVQGLEMGEGAVDIANGREGGMGPRRRTRRSTTRTRRTGRTSRRRTGSSARPWRSR